MNKFIKEKVFVISKIKYKVQVQDINVLLKSNIFIIKEKECEEYYFLIIYNVYFNKSGIVVFIIGISKFTTDL